MTQAVQWALLALCAVAAVWPPFGGRLRFGATLRATRALVCAALFVFLVSRLQGGALTGDFFARGLWGRGSLALAVLWVAGLALALGRLQAARLPLGKLALIAGAGLCLLALAQSNGRAFAGILLVVLAVAALWYAAGQRLTGMTALLAGFLFAGAAVLAESGPEPHLAFSAWWVALFLPLYEAAAGAVRSLWSAIDQEKIAPSLYDRLTVAGRRGRVLYWGAAVGGPLLALAHYRMGWPGVHVVAALLAGAALVLEQAASRLGKRVPKQRGWSGAQWAALALVLFACLTRAPNVLHQGFLTWDESRYASIARDFLTTHDLGWTGGRPVYILLLGWAYAAWGVGDSVGGLVSVLAGLLSIALAYAWARQAFGRQAGLAAAAVLTASILHSWFSRYQNSMAVAAALLACAGWAIARGWVGSRPWGALLAAGAALGLALASHYALALAIPFWLLLAPFGAAREGWLRRAKRLAAVCGGLAAALGAWVVLMPRGSGPVSDLLNHSGVPIGCCIVDDMRNHLFPGSVGGTFAPPAAAFRPWLLLSGDLGFYFRTLLAFEGGLGLALILAALVWGAVRWMRRREFLVLQVWVVSVGPLAVLSATAGAGLDARARTLVDILPSLAILVALMLADLGAGLAARLGARAGTLAYGALLAGLVLWSAARAAPLRAMTTPYAGVRDWLLQRGADEVVVYHPYGDDNGFAWQFYFGSQAYFADTESDVLRACAEHAPAFMITAGEPLRALAGLPLVARFANPIYSTIPRLYDQRPHSGYLGHGLVGPPQDTALWLYDLRGCDTQ